MNHITANGHNSQSYNRWQRWSAGQHITKRQTKSEHKTQLAGDDRRDDVESWQQKKTIKYYVSNTHHPSPHKSSYIILFCQPSFVLGAGDDVMLIVTRSSMTMTLVGWRTAGNVFIELPATTLTESFVASPGAGRPFPALLISDFPMNNGWSARRLLCYRNLYRFILHMNRKKWT